MKKICISTVCLFLSLFSFSQDIDVTFTALGEATSIDSVTAVNQRTNQSITLPGNEILILSQSSGIENISSLKDQIVVYPNPFSGSSRVMLTLNEPQKVNLRIQNMTGQVIAQTDEYLQAGANEFEISLSDNGFYVFVLEIQQDYKGCKLVSLSSYGQENKINYTGVNSALQNHLSSSGMKSGQTEYSLNYTIGDNIHYTCTSGAMTTIFTDSPEKSKNYDVEFAQCTDPDGKNYDIVIIGDQIWMEDNLAYLPSVSPPEVGSDSLAFYYVYDYEGDIVAEAKVTEIFKMYGVLYNWTAAMNGASSSSSIPSGMQGICPEGWHIPSNPEWTKLTDFLIVNGYGFGTDRFAIGKSAASSSGWSYSSDRGDVGNNQSTNNSSGFNAYPGGKKDYPPSGEFRGLGYATSFWSCTPYISSSVWLCLIWRNAPGMWLLCPDHPGSPVQPNRAWGYSVRCLKDSE